MTEPVSRLTTVVVIWVFLAGTFGGGSASYALFTDAETTESAPITIEKTTGGSGSDGPVAFNTQCDRVDVTVSGSTYEFTVTTANGDSRQFSGESPSDNEVSINGNNKNRNGFGRKVTFASVTIDGTEYTC
ncbi:hypothetical protein ACOZ4I_10540 [Haloarcula salina]|uniref:hypothetical protein n=1 Tax=Haloarcula salina TaxID=1429914 RepID=UPI003C6FBAA6